MVHSIDTMVHSVDTTVHSVDLTVPSVDTMVHSVDTMFSVDTAVRYFMAKEWFNTDDILKSISMIKISHTPQVYIKYIMTMKL